MRCFCQYKEMCRIATSLILAWFTFQWCWKSRFSEKSSVKPLYCLWISYCGVLQVEKWSINTCKLVLLLQWRRVFNRSTAGDFLYQTAKSNSLSVESIYDECRVLESGHMDFICSNRTEYDNLHNSLNKTNYWNKEEMILLCITKSHCKRA